MPIDSAKEPVKVQISRPMVGIISLVCLGLWIFLYARDPNAEGDMLIWQGGFMRSGLLMGAFWFALPSKNRDAAWANVSPRTLVGMIVAFGAIVARPKVFVPLFLALGVVAWFLRPRKTRRDERPDREWNRR